MVRSPRIEGRAGIGIFQTKMNWRDPADLKLIRHSAAMPREHTQFNADIPMRLNFPGIGMGGLKKEQGSPIIDKMFGDVEDVSIYYI